MPTQKPKTTKSSAKKNTETNSPPHTQAENLRLRRSLKKEIAERRSIEDVLLKNEQISRQLAETALRQAQELSLLERVRSTIAIEINLAPLLRNVVRSIAEVYGYTHVSIYLLEGETLVLQHQVGYKKVVARIGLQEGISGQVARTGEPVLLEDVTQATNFIGAVENLRSEITVPLKDNNRAAGTLTVESESTLTKEDLKILVALSADVGVAIERARLYEDLQRRNHLLSALQESTLVIMGQLSLPEALQAIMDKASQLMKTPHGFIYLIQPDGTLQIKTGIGIYPEFIGTTVRPGEGLAGRVLESATPLIANHYQTWEGRSHQFEGTPFQAVMGTPLLQGEKVIGVLGFAHVKTDSLFSADDVELLSRFAQLASIALENAALYTKLSQELNDRKQAEERLRASEERLTAVIVGSQLGYSDWNMKSGVIQRNERWAGMLGYTLHELETNYNQWSDLLHPEDRESALKSMQDHIDGVTSIHRDVYRLRTKEGSYRWILDQGMIIERDHQGHPLRLTATHTDITERKLAEEALRKNEQRLLAFFNQSLDGFFFCDFEEPIAWKHTLDKEKTLEYIFSNKRFTDVNEAMLNQYELKREAFLSLTTKDIFTHDPEQGRRLRRQLFDKGHLHTETFERTFSGKPVWFEGDYVCLYDVQERLTGYFGIQRDITERKRAERELRQHVQNTITMYELGKSIHTGLDLDKVYQEAHRAVQRLMPCDSFLIALLDPHAHLIEDVYMWDDGIRWESTRHPLGQGLSSYIIATGRPLFVNEWTEEHDQLTNAMNFGESETFTRAALAAPLFTMDGTCFGMMTAQAYITRAYTTEHEHLFITLASQISKAIENANLFKEVETELAERKRTETALRESEERYRTLFAGMLDGVYRSTHDGRFLDINPAMVKMFGYASREEMLGVDIKKDLYFSPEERLSLFMDTGEEKVDEFRMKRKDGSEIWVEDHGHYVHDQNGNVTYHEGILRDITERRHAELAMRAAEEKYRSIFENAIEGMYQSSPDGHFLTVNPAFANIMGYNSPQQMIDEITDIAKQLYTDPTRRAEFKHQLDEQGNLTGFEYQMRRKDGKLVWVSENVRVVRGRDEKILYYEGILEDITARKQNEQRIDNQLKQLNALHAIDNAINSNFDLRMTLEVLLREVLAQLKVDAASVLLFNKDTHTLDYTAGRGFQSKATQHTKLNAGEGFAGRVIIDRKTLHVPDLSRTDNRLAAALSLAGENFTAYIGSPLIAKGQIVGVLEIFQRSPLNPDANWFEFLSMITDQAAIAIDNAQLFENLQRTNFDLTLAYDATIEGWSRALDLRDRETEGHTQRVTNLTVRLAHRMGIPDYDILHIRRGALLHDIGKMGIPDNILHKPDQLTADEWEIMRQHTSYAYKMLSPIHYLKPALDIPRFHHERWDGTGYPEGLRGEQIPIAARIFAVVDVWDALTSNRSYREAWDRKKALEYICNESGKHFDPRVVDIFLTFIMDEEHG